MFFNTNKLIEDKSTWSFRKGEKNNKGGMFLRRPSCNLLGVADPEMSWELKVKVFPIQQQIMKLVQTPDPPT